MTIISATKDVRFKLGEGFLENVKASLPESLIERYESNLREFKDIQNELSDLYFSGLGIEIEP